MTQNGAVPPARIQLPHHQLLDPAIRRASITPAPTASDLGHSLPAARGSPTTPTVVVAMHPRVDFSRHYLAPRLAAAATRSSAPTRAILNHDADMLHERVLLDVAGSVSWVRARGFRRVVLLGNSAAGRCSRSTSSRR